MFNIRYLQISKSVQSLLPSSRIAASPVIHPSKPPQQFSVSSDIENIVPQLAPNSARRSSRSNIGKSPAVTVAPIDKSKLLPRGLRDQIQGGILSQNNTSDGVSNGPAIKLQKVSLQKENKWMKPKQEKDDMGSVIQRRMEKMR